MCGVGAGGKDLPPCQTPEPGNKSGQSLNAENDLCREPAKKPQGNPKTTGNRLLRTT